MGDKSLPENNEREKNGHDERKQFESIEMVDTPPSRDSTSNGPLHSNDTDIDGIQHIIHDRIKSQLPQSVHEGSPSSTRNDQPSDTYQNWSCDGGNINGHTDNKDPNNTDLDALDELAWKIISVVLKGWFVIWILFAVLIVTAELMSPQHSAKKKVLDSQSIVASDNGQLFLEISEHIVSACSYSKLDSEEGRGGCQSLCRNHMCCFIDDVEKEFELHKYGCANDAEKMCAAYAGCESLVLSEDDAIIFDADGVAVFGDDYDASDTSTPSSPTSDAAATVIIPGAAENSNLSSELQLVQQVISSVCSTDNLHSRHGMMECASLCNPSMCCFDGDEIELLNPKMDLILKMEGIGDDVLDRGEVMGTCANEEQEDGAITSTASTNHFCQVHAGCKNVLLFGAPSASSDKKRQPSSADHGEQQERRSIVTVCILFGLMIGLTSYLLIWNRVASSAALEVVRRNTNIGMGDCLSDDDFAQVGEIVDFV